MIPPVCPDGRVRVRNRVSAHTTRMHLDIFHVQEDDFNTYKCVSKNSLGETDGSINLYSTYNVADQHMHYIEYALVVVAMYNCT